MSFWENEGLWSAMGGGLGGALQVGGANASMADWLAAFAYGSGQAVDRRDVAMEQEQRRIEAEARAAEDRKFQIEDRNMRMKAAQEAAAEKLRMNNQAAARDQRAMEYEQNPYFVDPRPSPDEMAPGDFADDSARRRQAQQAQQQQMERYRMISEAGAKLGVPLTGDPKLDEEAVSSAMKSRATAIGKGGGPGGGEGLSPSEQLARERFNLQQTQRGEDKASAATKEAAELVKNWRKEYQQTYQDMRGEYVGTVSPEAEAELRAKARQQTEEFWGPEPLDPRQTLAQGQNPAVRKPPPVETPEFSGKMPTPTAKVSSPTSATAPPRVTPIQPAAKKLEVVDSQINSAFPSLPPEIRAKLKARVMQAVYRHGMTIEQAMAQAQQAAYGTQFAPGQ